MTGLLHWGLQPARLCPRAARENALPAAQAGKLPALSSKTVLSSQLKVCVCVQLQSTVWPLDGEQVVLVSLEGTASKSAFPA